MRHEIVLSYADLMSLRRGDGFQIALGGESVTVIYERVRQQNGTAGRISRNAMGPASARCQRKRCRKIFHGKTKAAAQAGLRLHMMRIHTRKVKTRGER